MTQRLYPRLAWQGITKNKRLYLPFLLTCVGMVMMTYILLSLASSPVLKTFPGEGLLSGAAGTDRLPQGLHKRYLQARRVEERLRIQGSRHG